MIQINRIKIGYTRRHAERMGMYRYKLLILSHQPLYAIRINNFLFLSEIQFLFFLFFLPDANINSCASENLQAYLHLSISFP